MQLWDHQRKAVEKSKDRNNLALFFDAGTGKSATTINIILEKWNRQRVKSPVLIFCPPVVVENWRREWIRFANLPPDLILPLVGSQKKRIELIQTNGQALVYVTNYESLTMKELFAALEKRFANQNGILVLDESHKVKDIKAQRTKRAIDLSECFTHKYLLTGTPVLKSYMDLYSQFRVLNKGFGTNFFMFRAKYFFDKNAGMPSHKHFPDFKLREGAEAEIKAIVDEHASFAKKSDCLDLPPLLKIRVEVEMGTEQKRLYESMKKNFVAEVQAKDGQQKFAVAELVITKALRLQQIVSGHIKVQNDDGTTTALQIKDNPRRDALKQLLEDLTPAHKVIVWGVFKDNYQDIRQVCDELGIKYVEITGETTDKQASVDTFNSDPSCRVCIGNPGAGGIGINLIAASYAIYYSRSFSLEHDMQSEARNYRGGSEIHEKITRIDLVAPQTIDDLVLKTLANKQELSDNILRENIKDI